MTIYRQHVSMSPNSYNPAQAGRLVGAKDCEMLEEVQAVRFIKELSSGRNRPWLIEAERWDGEVVEAVVKLGSAECGPGGLVREAYAAMLAADLDLPVSEPFIVSLIPDFVETLDRENKARVEGHALAFGSKFVPGMLPVCPGSDLPAGIRNQAATAFAFDAGILNSDRLVTKPNCLTDGSSIMLIDHELSLNLYGRGFLVLDPWGAGSLGGMANPPSKHLFYDGLKLLAGNANFPGVGDFCHSLSQVNHNRVSDYHDAIPSQWDVDNLKVTVRDFISELIDNAAGLRTQVEAVVS